MIGSTPELRTKTEKRWLKVLSTLNEFQARLFVADKALDLGRGGISWLFQLTGLSRTTITKAVEELKGSKALCVPPGGGARQPGGGRKKLEQIDPRLQQDLRRMVEESTAGDPMSLLRWNPEVHPHPGPRIAWGTPFKPIRCGASWRIWITRCRSTARSIRPGRAQVACRGVTISA